jgi:serine/threonine-protein kinase
MPLIPGTRLGVYEVTAKIGEGGMGEVYQARDTTLDRDVALKVLPEAFTADPDRLARFQREAKVLASLNHPNIGGIHGLEESGETQALVLELIEGPTLADRIAEGPVPVEEALNIAKQIADALEAAHDQGIVHRDLKPANVKVRSDGTVKVLDFGLAKAATPEVGGTSGSDAATMSLSAATQVGMVVGTAAYMSPEQAKGKVVDKGTDVWAFGAVLYEMLTGTRAFPGDDMSDTFASVLAREPAFDALPVSVPPGVRRLLTRCLEKDQQKRLRDLTEGFVQMEDAAARAEAPTVSVAPAPLLRLWQKPIPVFAGVLLTAVVSGLGVWTATRPGTAPVSRFNYELPGDQSFQVGRVSLVAFSPDGSRFIYNTAGGLYLRSLDTEQAQPLSGTAVTVRNPVFSPDGEWVAYFSTSDSRIEKIAVSGGAPVTLTAASMPFGMSWEADGTILFGQPAGVMRVSENGGTAELVVEALDGEQVHGPQLLLGGEWILFSSTTGTGISRWNDGTVVAESVETGERRLLVTGGSDARYLASGHLVYALENVLFAVAFDLGRMEVTGGPVSVVEGVERANNPQGNSGTGHFSVSAGGNLVYVQGGTAVGQERTLALVNRTGQSERLDLPPNQYISPRLSPDGDRLAVQTDGDSAVIWTYDLSGANAIQRLTVDGNNYRPLWSPDGERIAFASDRNGPISLYWQNADGSGVAEQLTAADEGTAHWPEAWSPDGQTLVYKVEQTSAGGWNIQTNEMDLWTLSLENPDERQAFAADPYPVLEVGATFSPDGRWLAYTVGDGPAIEYEIWAQPFPPTGERRRISQEYGVMPTWSQDGEELFYRPISQTPGMRQTLRSISVSTTPSFTFSTEQPVSIGDFLSFSFYRSFDITADRQSVLVVLSAEQTGGDEAPQPQLHVVLNWFEELKERVPVP